MKRQAEGAVSVANEGVQQAETNGSKRIKLLNNEAPKGVFQVDETEEQSTMDDSLTESSRSSNNDHSSSITKHNAANNHSAAVIETEENRHNLTQNMNGDFNYVAVNNYNGSHEEAVEVTAHASENAVELNSNSHENGEENNSLDDRESMPPVLSCCYELHNNESTDSFQSEGFEAENSLRQSSNNTSDKQICEEQNNDEVKESSVDLDLKKCNIDADNLILSHLTVTQLQGHSDVVFSVAADEDYVLSASADTTVKVWSLERKSAISTFSGHSGSVSAVLLLNPMQSKVLKKKMSLTKVSRIAITGSLDCNIKVWSVLDGKELSSIYTFNGITCLGYLESECLVVVGTEGGKLQLWDIASGKVIKSENAHEDLVTDIQVKDGNIYSVSTDGTVKVWAYEDEDIYPLYSRKRKEISSSKMELKPAEWKTVAISEDVLYLGDNTKNIKVLDWRAGRLRLFKNQTEDQGVCECVVAQKNILFTTYFDSSSGGINVWKLPELTYVCTLTDSDSYIHSLAAVQKDNKLQIVCGGHKLSIWEFDCSSPPSSETECSVQELETLGLEIDEKAVQIKNAENDKSSIFNPDQNNSNNGWCSVM